MIAHPQDMDYAYRGKELKDLSLVEYACVVEIVKRRSDKEQPEESLDTGDTDDSALHYNRESERNTLYPFDVMHPLFATHRQMVRSKLFIPLLCGGKLQTSNNFFIK